MPNVSITFYNFLFIIYQIWNENFVSTILMTNDHNFHKPFELMLCKATSNLDPHFQSFLPCLIEKNFLIIFRPMLNFHIHHVVFLTNVIKFALLFHFFSIEMIFIIY